MLRICVRSKPGHMTTRPPYGTRPGSKSPFLPPTRPAEKPASVTPAASAVAAASPAGGVVALRLPATPATPTPAAAAPAVVPASPAPAAVGSSPAQAAPLVYRSLSLVRSAMAMAENWRKAYCHNPDTPGMPQGYGRSARTLPFSFPKATPALYFRLCRFAQATPRRRPNLRLTVDIWSSRDPLLQPMQKIRADSGNANARIRPCTTSKTKRWSFWVRPICPTCGLTASRTRLLCSAPATC